MIYYACNNKGRIKIGYSSSPLKRVASLRCILFAVEPGDRRTEKARHHQFKKYHIEGEWYEMKGRLFQYIKGLQEKVAFFKMGYLEGYTDCIRIMLPEDEEVEKIIRG